MRKFGFLITETINCYNYSKSSNSWRIASYVSFVVIVGLTVLNIIPRSGKKGILEKSVAVLPFRNDSPDEEKMYFINGTVVAEEIEAVITPEEKQLIEKTPT